MELSSIKEELRAASRNIHTDPTLQSLRAHCYANLRNMRPDLSKPEYDRILMEAYYYTLCCHYEEADIETVNQIETHFKGDNILTAHESPRIFATFHFGSYRLINSLLIKHGIKFKTLTINGFIKRSENQYKNTFYKLAKEYGNTHELGILDAESPKILFEIIRSVKEGYSIVIFQDGNAGVDGVAEENKNLQTVNFLGRHIRVRKGIGYMSYLTKAPVAALFIPRVGGKYIANFCSDILPEMHEEREAYCTRILENLYGNLEQYVLQYPEQWDGWFNLQKFIVKKDRVLACNKFRKKKPFRFNSKEFIPFEDSQGQFLLDQASYKSIDISKPLFEILNESENRDLSTLFDLDDSDTLELVTQLYDYQVLVQ